MPQGFYTIEQWVKPTRTSPGLWHPILHLPFGTTLTAAENALAKLGKPGLYRVIQMQRVIWAEEQDGDIKLRKSHAGSPQGLEEIVAMFDRSNGRYPAEEVREARRKAKR